MASIKKIKDKNGTIVYPVTTDDAVYDSLTGQNLQEKYATKDSLNTKSDTSHTHSELHSHDNKNILDTITEEKIAQWNSNSESSPSFSGDYNDLTNKPTIPTKLSELVNDSEFASKSYVDTKFASINLDLYQEKEDYTLNTTNKTVTGAINELKTNVNNITVPTKTSQLTNDSNFADKTYVNEKVADAITSGTVDLSNYQTKTDSSLNTTNKTVTGAINELKANVDNVDLSNYALKSELHTHSNKAVLDNITSTNIANWNTAYNHSQSATGEGGGTVIASELTFSTLSEALSYGYSTTDEGKKVIVNDGRYIVTTATSDWTLSTSTSGIYLNITNTDYVSYAMFGCPLNGTDDDTVGMQKAHAYSNANKVLLKNNSGTIYKADNTILKVKWDMDLSGSTILVKNNNCEGMYQIVNDTETVYGYTSYVDKSYLRQGTCQFPMTDNSLPANCVIHMTDKNAWATRNDSGNIYTENRYELMFHHAFGICSGDLVADWSGDDTNLTFNYTKYNNRRLTVRGCRIRLESTSTIYCCLFNCIRHNTLITDMFIDTKPSSITAGSTSFKNAIIQIKDAYNTEISNITGTNIAGTESTRNGSGYVIRLINVYKCVLDNLNLNGFWGATGMNCVKDITIQNTTINRIDVHSYFSDMNVRDTTIYDWGVCLGFGSGSFTANNVKFVNLERPNMGGRCLVDLNNTYGNLFSGDITLRDCEMITDDNDMSVIKLDFIDGNTPTRATVRMPNINIHNLKAINIGSTEASLYMFNINGTSDFSSATTKIGRANYYKFEDISFNNLSNVNQDIRFIWDSTTKDMYQDDVRTDIKIKNTNFNQTLPTDGLFAYVNCGEYITNADISTYQTKTDSSLNTTNKTIVGAINELKTSIGNGSDSSSGSSNSVFINVKSFVCNDGEYVKGDGAHDDTTGIQAALDSFYNPSDYTGVQGTLVFPGGTYKISSELVMQREVNILGQNGARLRADSLPSTQSMLKIAIPGTDTRNVKIEGLTFLQNNGGADCIYIPGIGGDYASITTWTIDNCSFQTVTEVAEHYAIHVENENFTHSQISNSTFMMPSYFNCGDCNRIENCMFMGNECAITYNLNEGVRNNTVENCTIVNTNGAIRIIKGDNIRIKNNQMEHYKMDTVSGSPKKTMVWVEGNGRTCINTVISENNFGGGTNLDYLIYLENADRTIIEKNNLVAVNVADIHTSANTNNTIIKTDNYSYTQVSNPRGINLRNYTVEDLGIGTMGTEKSMVLGSGLSGGKYFKDENGVVRMLSPITGSMAVGTNVITMPPKFRPTENEIISGYSPEGLVILKNVGDGVLQISVLPSGTTSITTLKICDYTIGEVVSENTGGGSSSGGDSSEYIIYDSFARSDSTSLGTTEVGSKTWQVTNNNIGISNGEAKLNDASVSETDFAIIDTGLTDFTLTCTFSKIPSEYKKSDMIVFRYADANNYYYMAADWASYAWAMWEVKDGTETLMIVLPDANNIPASAGLTCKDGDVLQVKLEGNLFTIIINGSTIYTGGAYDNTTATKCGFALYQTYGRIDNFGIKQN